jgi:D-alanine-D-alanine ligase
MTSHVAVLAGGTSLEREVSLRSGRRVQDALTDRGYRVTGMDVDAHLVRTLDEGGFDVAFLALHGSAGEDGTIQSLLELVGMPYTGPDVLASSLAWNKPIAQGLYRRAGIAVPDHVVLSQQAFREMGAAAAVDHVAAELGTPLVIKPATGGSSLGLSVVEDASRLSQAILGAFSYAEAVLVERFVAGTEIAVTLLDGQPLPAVEIHPKEGVYDFAARYTAGATEFHAPARISERAAEACADAATAAVEAVGARDVTRADLILDPDGVPWLLELDTCPGLTETSLVPMAAQAAGLEFEDLCERLVRLALERGP